MWWIGEQWQLSWQIPNLWTWWRGTSLWLRQWRWLCQVSCLSNITHKFMRPYVWLFTLDFRLFRTLISSKNLFFQHDQPSLQRYVPWMHGKAWKGSRRLNKDLHWVLRWMLCSRWRCGCAPSWREEWGTPWWCSLPHKPDGPRRKHRLWSWFDWV